MIAGNTNRSAVTAAIALTIVMKPTRNRTSKREPISSEKPALTISVVMRIAGPVSRTAVRSAGRSCIPSPIARRKRLSTWIVSSTASPNEIEQTRIVDGLRAKPAIFITANRTSRGKKLGISATRPCLSERNMALITAKMRTIAITKLGPKFLSTWAE